MSHQTERRVQTSKASTAVGRFRGPTADELFLLCRPDEGVVEPTRQAEIVYEGLLDVLASEGAGPEALVTETVFLRRVREDFPVARSARSRVLGGSALRACGPATTVIGQPPLANDAHLELAAVAVLPRSPRSSAVHEVRRSTACACDTCAPGLRATVVRLGDQVSLYAGNIHGSGRAPSAEAYDMFRVADGLLAEAGMRFGSVVRTWIHVRDIDRHYDALNEARRAFFRDYGYERLPASTGIQGIPLSDVHDFSLSLHAMKSRRPFDVAPMSSPLLNEAWSYGADFSRGLKVVEPGRATFYVSGTASIDEAGRTAHMGDIEAQVDRMLHNIASLLAPQGATFGNLVSGVAYLRNPNDAPVLRAMFRKRGFEGFPCALVEAPLCRPELLCEAEAVAMLPLATTGA